VPGPEDRGPETRTQGVPITGRALRAGLAVLVCAAAAALAAPYAPASAAAARATQPTLSLEKDCETFPGFNSVNITLAGLPPFTEFVGTVVTPEGLFGSSSETTDASGSFELTIGTQEPDIFEVTVVWSAGTLTQSLFVDCSTPASKEECKHDGWQRFGFKNQGQCIAFVNHGPQTRAAGLSE
jgi:hypothetical protein